MFPYSLLLLLNLFCESHQQPGEAEKNCNYPCIEKIHSTLLIHIISEEMIKIVQRMVVCYKDSVKTGALGTDMIF